MQFATECLRFDAESADARFDGEVAGGFGQSAEFKAVVKFFLSNKMVKRRGDLPLHHFS